MFYKKLNQPNNVLQKVKLGQECSRKCKLAKECATKGKQKKVKLKNAGRSVRHCKVKGTASRLFFLQGSECSGGSRKKKKANDLKHQLSVKTEQSQGHVSQSAGVWGSRDCASGAPLMWRHHSHSLTISYTHALVQPRKQTRYTLVLQVDRTPLDPIT